MAKPLPKDDLDHVIEYARQDLEQLRGARLFVTGGTGFFGKWIVETFLHANRELQLGATVTLLTRAAHRFQAECPHLASDPSLSFHVGDVRTFEFPTATLSHIIHGAVASSDHPMDSFETSVDGTRRVIDFATKHGTERVLFLSSGAVYGPQPSEMTHIPETHLSGPDPLLASAGYGEGKRAAEYLICATPATYGLEPIIARCFAFVGPHLPLNTNFAIGNFIADVLAGRAISIQGDGTPYRSYLHAADLAVWLWTLLVRGTGCRAYNVGSDESLTIAELARLVAEGTACEVHIAKTPMPGAAPLRYVPSIERAKHELGLAVRIKLRDGIQRTLEWLRSS